MLVENVADIIQDILDKNGKSFMALKTLAQKMGADLRVKLGIKTTSTAPQIKMFLEPYIDDRFMFKTKGKIIYIFKPCDPSDFVLSGLSQTAAKSPKIIAGSAALLSKKEAAEILNDLIKRGKVQTFYTDDLEPRLISADSAVKVTTKKSPVTSRAYTQAEFKRAFDELDKGKIFVRICDLRRKLNWPRDTFDKMLKNLRDEEIIQLHTGDASLMTVDEVNDCFIDENNFRMGSVTWNDR